MSTYYTHEGHLTFETMSDFLMVTDALTSGGWLRDGHFVDECGSEMSEDANIDPEKLELTVPLGLYHNLFPYRLTQDCPVKGYLITTCTDGCFSGSVMLDGFTFEHDLERWGNENFSPLPDKYELDDKYFEWVHDVEGAFIDYYRPTGV